MGIPFDIPKIWERVYSAGQSTSTKFAKKVLLKEVNHYYIAISSLGLSYCRFLNISAVEFIIPRNSKWRGWDSNPQPMAYESTAPPLSYLANCVMILTE